MITGDRFVLNQLSSTEGTYEFVSIPNVIIGAISKKNSWPNNIDQSLVSDSFIHKRDPLHLCQATYATRQGYHDNQ